MPLCVRRPIQLTRGEFDFDANPPLDYGDMIDEIDGSRVYTPAAKRSLVNILGHFTQLCVCLTDVLSLVYPTKDLPVLDIDASSGTAERIKELRRALRYWSKSATRPLTSTDLPPGMNVSGESLVLDTHLIWIYYL